MADYTMADWKDIAIRELATHLGEEHDAAERYATDRVLDDLENEPEMFNTLVVAKLPDSISSDPCMYRGKRYASVRIVRTLRFRALCSHIDTAWYNLMVFLPEFLPEKFHGPVLSLADKIHQQTRQIFHLIGALEAKAAEADESAKRPEA